MRQHTDAVGAIGDRGRQPQEEQDGQREERSASGDDVQCAGDQAGANEQDEVTNGTTADRSASVSSGPVPSLAHYSKSCVHGGSIVQDIVLLYALALVLLLVGGRLRAPATVSLILTGVLAGPGGFGLVGSEDTVRTLSEIGIALLLFMVGLDLSFSEVRRLWRSVTVGGSAQMLGTMAVVAPFAVLWTGPRAGVHALRRPSSPSPAPR